MPLQYKRLTAHLQTGSADFNKRLSNYLANHVAMRSALDQAITASYAQQYPNAPQFAHNRQTMYPSPFSSPFMAHSMPQQQTPQSFVQSPYNAATGTPSYRPVHHFRSASITNPQDVPGYPQTISSPVQRTNDRDQRRMSKPTESLSSPTSALTLQSPYSGKNPTSPIHPMNKEAQSPGQMQPPPQPAPQPQSQQQRRPYANLSSYADYSPFTTTSLPTETQMMIGSGHGLDPNDPLTSMFMAGSEGFPQPSYNSNQFQFYKVRNTHPSYDAMSATLSPSALDMSPHDGTIAPASVSFTTLDGVNEFSKELTFTRSNSSHGSGTGTPSFSNQDWNNFINQDSWTENGTWSQNLRHAPSSSCNNCTASLALYYLRKSLHCAVISHFARRSNRCTLLLTLSMFVRTLSVSWSKELRKRRSPLSSFQFIIPRSEFEQAATCPCSPLDDGTNFSSYIQSHATYLTLGGRQEIFWVSGNGSSRKWIAGGVFLANPTCHQRFSCCFGSWGSKL